MGFTMKNFFRQIPVLAGIFLLCTNTLEAQHAPGHVHNPEGKSGTSETGAGIESRGYSGTGANIDVTYHKCNWRINPDSSVKYIRGFVQTNFTATENNVSDISFDLHSALTVDSIVYRGSKLPAAGISHLNNILTISLGVMLASGTRDSVLIYYKGTPPGPSGGAQGYLLATNGSTGQKYIYTVSESYEDRNWWPCKADMQDKIDSADIIVSTPWSGADTFWVASNGKLVDSTITGNSRTFVYKSRYPIASYLVSVCVARFNRYYNAVNVSGTPMQVAYYLQRGKSEATYTSIVNAMNNINQVLALFNDKFSDYAFKNEKHGFYEGISGGGMEHQTFSAIASNALTDYNTLAHELAHQWFGDKVTFATWNDLWLSEGFATYGAILAEEMVPALGRNPVNTRKSTKTAAQAYLNSSAYIPDASIASSTTIWNSSYGSTIYNRGGMVVSMLRTMLGDAKFFTVLRNYQSAPGLAYKSATTDSLKYYVNQQAGRDLSAFFTDYVKGTGHPTYDMVWNSPYDNWLFLRVAGQTRTANSTVGYFHGPVAVRVQGSLAAQDTTLVFYDDNGTLSYCGPNGFGATVTGNVISYNLPFKPVTVTFDPNALTMANGNIVKDENLPIYITNFYGVSKNQVNELTLLLEERGNVVLERAADGNNFKPLGNMVLQTAGTAGFTYVLKDELPIAGINYYRAFITNAGGEILYSKTIQLNAPGIKPVFAIAPNPVKHGTLQLSVSGLDAAATDYSISVYDMQGKLLQHRKQTLQNGTTSLPVNLLTRGVYQLALRSKNGTETLRFVVD